MDSNHRSSEYQSDALPTKLQTEKSGEEKDRTFTFGSSDQRATPSTPLLLWTSSKTRTYTFPSS